MVTSLVPFVAVGPGFKTRKRDRVLELALQLLFESRYHELRSVDCDFFAGRLVLHGTVSSFYLKQVAQTVVANLPGVVQIDNQLEVVAEDRY